MTTYPKIHHPGNAEMPRITEELVRKRAEHNNGEVATLEELSLHQQELERIEHLDRWCRHLKILYLQNNLIPRIENVGRLKDLQYLNLALNNVEKVENLEGCEFLEKLDFTVNFIGDLLSVESLSSNLHLRELYLTGNPCADYEGYRAFVVATLPQIATLDGKNITKSERITASQQLENVRKLITKQQSEHALKREKEKKDFNEKHCREKKPGFDGRWYTDSQAHVPKPKESMEGGELEEEEEEEEEAYTPEYRVKNHRDMERKKLEQAKEPENKLEMPKRVRTLERGGKMLNVNEGKYSFHLKDEGSHYFLEVECPRYMDTSLIDCDIQTTCVRVTIKSKMLQLVLDEDISPDSSSAKRSQTTGHLLLELPKAKPLLHACQEVVRGENACQRKKEVVGGASVHPQGPSAHLQMVGGASTCQGAKMKSDRNNPLSNNSQDACRSDTDILTDDSDVPPLV